MTMLLEQLPSITPADLGVCMSVAEDLAGMQLPLRVTASPASVSYIPAGAPYCSID